MNWYVITPSTSDEYLEHGWFKDTARKVHKYILRVKDGAKWRYFYTKAEIDAWIQKKKKSNEPPANLHSRQKKVGRGRVTARKKKRNQPS